MHAGEILGSTATWAAGRSSSPHALRQASSGGGLRARGLIHRQPAQHGRGGRGGRRLRAGEPAQHALRGQACLQEHLIAILGRLSRLWLKPDEERAIALKHIEALSIRPPSAERPLGTLSGGNQQKVALAKWLTYLPKVLILSEPTRGMDVGAKDDVVRIVRAFATRASGSSSSRASLRPCCHWQTGSSS